MKNSTIEKLILSDYKLIFKKLGFSNRYKTWWKRNGDFILIFDFQKSQ